MIKWIRNILQGVFLMKKALSVMLAILMLFSLCLPCFAVVKDEDVSVNASKSQYPIIRILGDGEPLYDADGNRLFHLRTDLLEGGGNSSTAEEDDGDDIYDSLAGILMPFLKEGLLFNNWEPYYDALEEEIADLTGNARLDANGNAPAGTGLSAEKREYMATAATKNQGKKGYFAINDYRFWYDWRLDPIETAAKLHEYIQQVKAITGKDKVCILASCVGTIVTTTYVGIYGVEDIHGIGYTGAIVKGAEILSEAISGKFDTDSEAIGRVLEDCGYLGFFNLDEFLDTTLNLALQSGIIDSVVGTIRLTLYDKLVKGVTSALALSTFYTFPSYWAAIAEQDYEDALVHVFGEEGSAKRTEYAGLIEKIENYNTLIRPNIDDILLSIGEGGANFAAIAKYGFQMIPICKSREELSDQYVSVKRAGFNATTANIYDTLSDDYIAQQTEKGLERYISPDKKIDASTCLYPDSTWFVKNSSHSQYTKVETKLLYDVISAETQLTVNDYYDYTQFMVYDYDTTEMHAMTEDNCNTEQWLEDKPVTGIKGLMQKITNFFKTLINWFKLAFEKLTA